jgi:methylase of polypeptide subunit release factors
LKRPAALEQFRECLRSARYEEERIERVVRDEGRLPYGVGLAVLRLRPDADEPLPLLIRLFLAGERLPKKRVSAALAPVDLAELQRVGLLTVRDAAVEAKVALQPFEGLVIASDRSTNRPRPGHVVQVGPATQTLAALTVRREVQSSLDLGTGSGVHALLASGHSTRVVGTDLNPRALRLARLNAALNRAENVEWRQGDLYAPVRDERFGLVAANPPFVVSPARELTYRDGGRAGDSLSREAVTGAALRLDEGGYASVLCSWVTEPGTAGVETPREWLAGSGCDALVLELATDSPVTYAVHWNSPGRRPAAVADAVEPWLAHYRARGIRAISTGVIVLRKRSGDNWTRSEEVGLGPRGAAGDHIERIFAAEDRLRSLRGDGDLLELPLALAPGTLLVERRRPGGELERARITVEEGIPLPGHVPVSLAPVIAALDGRRPLAALIDAAARRETLPALRRLLARGLLVAEDSR